MRSLLICISCIAMLFSCTDNLVVSDYKAIDDGKWKKDGQLSFSFSEIDTITQYNMFLTIRNDETYPFSNLFLIADLEYPDGKTVTDTLEYEMARPNGEWLGKGSGSIKENKLWFRDNIVFPSSGVYNLKLSHAMRKNGKVDGIEELEGITDVGFQIEKSNL